MKQTETLREFETYAMTEGVTFWDLLDVVPAKYQPIASLLSWSLNYDTGNPSNPWTLFLDLVGFSVDEYGCRVSSFYTDEREHGLGWVELDYLANALTVWADDPHGCESVTRVLVSAEEY